MSNLQHPHIESASRPDPATGAVAQPAQVAAIIVLFHPDWEFVRRNLARLTGQVGTIVLVDNTPDPAPPPEPLPEKVGLITLGENTGIAHAQNVGATEAERLGAGYLVFFDQDSEIGDALVLRLLEALAALIARGESIAAVGPRPFDTTKGEKHFPPLVARDQIHGRFTRVWHLISSGSLMPLETFNKVGPMDASLFIDSVDHEWCWRARHHGYSCFIDESIEMRHPLGNGTISFLGLRARDTTPTRLYYQFRNQIRLIFFSKDFAPPLSWRLKRLTALPIKFMIHIAFQADRGIRLRYMWAGIRHGLSNYRGAIPF